MRRAACEVTYSHVLPGHMSTHVESVQKAGMLLRAMAGPSATVQEVMMMLEAIFLGVTKILACKIFVTPAT